MKNQHCMMRANKEAIYDNKVVFRPMQHTQLLILARAFHLHAVGMQEKN